MAGLAVLPLGLAWALIAGLVLAAGVVVLLAASMRRVEVAGSTVRAGKAHIDVRWIAEVEPLDREQTSLALGQQADPRAFWCTSPWIRTSVQMRLEDPQDPTPYWLISSRHPDQLAAAISQAVDHDQREADEQAH